MVFKIITIKEENIVIANGLLHYSCHDFNNRNKWNYKHFVRDIQRKKPKDFVDLIGIAQQHEIKIVHTMAQK